MKTIAKFLFSLLVVAMLLGTLFNYGLFHELKEKTDTLAKQGLRHFLSLQDKLDVLEEVKDVFREVDEYLDADSVQTEAVIESNTGESDSLPVFAETEPPFTETDPPADTESESDITETPPKDTEAAPSETTALPIEPNDSSYTVCAYEGVIGVFDGDGALIETVNVALMTLPEADRAALEVGIEAASMDEVQRILDKLA